MKKLLVAMFVVSAPFVFASEDDAKKTVDWDYSLDLTAGGEAGNNENYFLKLGVVVDFDTDKWSGEIVDLTISDKVIKREDSEDEKRQDDKYELDGDIKRAIGKRTHVSANWSYDEHFNRGLDRAWSLGVGFGWTLWDDKKSRFELTSLGLAYKDERETDGTKDDDIWAQLKHVVSYQISDTTSFSWDGDIRLNTDKTDRVTSDQEFEIDNRIGKRLSLVVDIDWEWDSDPGEGVKENDVSLSVGMRIRS